MRKSIMLFIYIVILCPVFTIVASAQNVPSSAYIPSHMPAGTIIKYDENMGQGTTYDSSSSIGMTDVDSNIATADIPEIQSGEMVIYDALGDPVLLGNSSKTDMDVVQGIDVTNLTSATVEKLNKSQAGKISWYAGEGLKGACGKKIPANGAAHKTIAFYTLVHVKNTSSKKTTSVVIYDRGPYVAGRILDMVKTAYSKVDKIGNGVFKGSITY